MRTTIIVLFGGRSPEHPISCVSAGSIMAHLDPEHYEVVPVGITRTGAWVLSDVDPADPAELRIANRTLPEVTDRPDAHVALSTDAADAGRLIFVSGERAGETVAVADLVLPVLHGPHGEDGTVQGLLELSGIPYVGPGVLASATAMDKEFTKKLLAVAGLPVGRQVELRPGVADLTAEQRSDLGLPVFVKPARGGSSIGISRVTSWERFADAVAVAREHDDKVIVEAAIHGREIECGVLELPSGEVQASVVAEIHLPHESAVPDVGAGAAVGASAGTGGTAAESTDEDFYDFETKYLDDTAEFSVPADLDEKTSDLLRAEAVRAFRALDAKGLARVDFFLTADGPVINEVNTFPGFTPISMYPQMWAKTGVAYPELLSTLIDTELTRRSRS